MSRFSFLHAADLHLDSPLRGLDPSAPAERIRGATREALANLVSYAIEEKVAFVLLAGDLYDSRMYDWHTGQFLVQQLGRLLREGIEIVAIAGNHDPLQSLVRRLPVPGMMDCAEPATRLLDNAPVAVHGQSYAIEKTTDDLSRLYPAPVQDRFNVGLLHTACGQGGHENYAPCTAADLARRGYDYWALGHVHGRIELARDPWIVFPGNLQGRHVKEEGAKGASLVMVENGAVRSVEHVAFDVLRWRRLAVNATGAAGLDEVLNRVRLQLGNALLEAEGRFLAVRILLTGACPAHAELARSPEATREAVRGLGAEIAGPDAVFIEDVRIGTVPALDLAAMRQQPGPIAALLEALEQPPGIGDALADFVRDQVRRSHDELDPDHPARMIASGTIPDELAARARALVLAELAQR